MRRVQQFVLKILLICALTSIFLFQSAFADTKIINGWTEITLSPDSKVIYVSVEGDDKNDGLSKKSPVKTIKFGISLIRDGYPDHLLLKSGDVWDDEIIGVWKKSGRSENEPIVVGSYGMADRPIIKTGNSDCIKGEKTPVSNVVFTGIECVPHTRSDGNGPTGIRWLAPGKNILFEDMSINGYRNNIVIQELYGPISNIKIRNSIITDSYSTTSHSQGVFAQGINGLLIEGNILDHNGWSESITNAEPIIYNHNLYINVDVKNLVVVDNIISRASATGLQARPGGIVDNNLFIQNPISLTYGYGLGGSQNSPERDSGVSGRITNNVILEGTDIGDSPRGMAIDIANVNDDGVIIGHNIIANVISEPTNNAVITTYPGNGPVYGISNLIV